MNCKYGFNLSEWNTKKKYNIWTWTCPSLVYVPFPVFETTKYNKIVSHNVPLPHLIKTNEYPIVISCRLTSTARPTDCRTIQTIVFHLINYRIHNIRNSSKSLLYLHENRIKWARFGSVTRDTTLRAKEKAFEREKKLHFVRCSHKKSTGPTPTKATKTNVSFIFRGKLIKFECQLCIPFTGTLSKRSGKSPIINKWISWKQIQFFFTCHFCLFFSVKAFFSSNQWLPYMRSMDRFMDENKKKNQNLPIWIFRFISFPNDFQWQLQKKSNFLSRESFASEQEKKNFKLT